jgi:hypothetical protein
MGLGSDQRKEVKEMLEEFEQKVHESLRNEVNELIKQQFFKWVKVILLFTGGGIIGLYFFVFWSVGKTVNYLVSKQFEEPRIQQITREAASERASMLLERQIQPEVEKFKQDISEKSVKANEKIVSLEDSLSKATSIMGKLASINNFTSTVVAAQNDDRRAFDLLEQWANDPNNKFREQALGAWVSILDDNSGGPFFIPTGKFPWPEGYDPSQLSLNDLRRRYHELPTVMRPSLINYIWKREDFSKLDRLDFMMEIMKSDPSLKAVRYAGHYFSKGTKQQIKPLAVSLLSQWWLEHRDEFVEKTSKQVDANSVN